MRDNYQIITGTLSELEVIDMDGQFLASRKLSSLPALGLLALGDSAAAASQRSLADNNEESVTDLNSMQYFKCKVGNIHVEGIFCRAFFTNGDKVEVVVEPQEDGCYFAYALRRPIDHRLWLHPDSMQGTEVGKKEALRYTTYFFVFLIFVSTVMCLYLSWKLSDKEFFIITTPLMFLGSFLFCVFFYFYWKSGISRGSKVADNIFATLGYPNPKEVDMTQELMEFYFNNKHESDPDFYVDITTRQYKQDTDGVKWVTFYREAPPIPDDITVIDGDKVNNTNYE